MKQLIGLLIVVMLGVVTPSILNAQYNRISVQTGLFHCFFDGSSLMNTNYLSKDRGIFGGLLYNSVGLQYTRKINSKNSISTEAMYFYEGYWNVLANKNSQVVQARMYMTYNLNYDRYLSLSKNLDFIYGGGINYRYGLDRVVVGYYGYGVQIVGRGYRDIGINLRTGIEYSPWRWLTLYTKFDLLGFVYLFDREHIKKMQSTYSIPNYPNRFDLSWRFGLGFNFGKVRDKVNAELKM